MKPIKWISMLALTLVLASAGCQADKAPADAEDIERETKEAVEATRDYMSQKASQFARESEETIARLEKQAEEWRETTQDLSEEARAASRKELAELEAKAAEARKEIKKLEGKSGTAWTDFKKNAEAALDDLQKAYDRAASRFSDGG